jgi:hypothetical protein
MNEHAQALGRLAKGHPKHITPIDRERRRKLLAEARKRRWLKNKGDPTNGTLAR